MQKNLGGTLYMKSSYTQVYMVMIIYVTDFYSPLPFNKNSIENYFVVT